jgi:hypothetical protein
VKTPNWRSLMIAHDLGVDPSFMEYEELESTMMERILGCLRTESTPPREVVKDPLIEMVVRPNGKVETKAIGSRRL